MARTKKYNPITDEINAQLEKIRVEHGINGMDVDDMATFFTAEQLGNMEKEINALLEDTEHKASLYAKGLKTISNELKAAKQLSQSENSL